MSDQSTAPLIISLIQITEPMLKYTNLPYAIGLLQAYVMRHALNPERYLFQELFFKRLPFNEALPRLSLAKIVGFSLYVWNEQYSLALAQELKQARPEVLIVFGGPQAPDRAEQYLRDHPWIDLICHGEGEQVFLEVLEAFPDRDWDKIPSLSWINQESHFCTTPRAVRIKDLDCIPSPFLKGYFAPLLLNYPEHSWVTAWETNRGCPFSCSYCDWGSATAAKVNRFGMERIKQELNWFGQQKIDVVFCCDANFGIFPRDLEIAQAAGQSKAQYSYPKLLYTQSTKNATERVYEVQKTLMEAGLNTTVTLALQSLSQQALKAIHRENISLQTFEDLQYRFKKDGIPTYTDVLIGLPEETFDSFVAGIGQIMAQGQHRELRTWQVFVLPNAELAAPEYRKKYALETVFIPYVSSYLAVKDPVEGIWEKHEMIVASRTMSREDWCRMCNFTWMTQSLYYSKALQLPIMLLNEIAGVPYQVSLLALLEGALPPQAEVLPKLRSYFKQRCLEMLAGQPEYVPGTDIKSGTLVWMNTEFFATIHLLTSPKLNHFYQECLNLFRNLLNAQGKTLPVGALEEAMQLAQAVFYSDIQGEYALDLKYNLWDLQQSIISGETAQLELKPQRLIRSKEHNGSFSLKRTYLAHQDF